ncbi:MAG: phosphoglycerate kinase [Patescibacteria group bacterium]
MEPITIPSLQVENIAPGTRVLLRASLNVPLEGGAVSNTFRLRESLETIESLAHTGARVVVCAHIGRAKTESLLPVWDAMKKESDLPIYFATDVCGSDATKKAATLKNGEVLLLENVRQEAGEETNDPVFAKKLASFGDVYVNDAFPDSHRAHASVVGVPALLPHFMGPNFAREYVALERARTPESPSLAIVGGAKLETKEPLLRTLLSLYDSVFVGGALANEFYKAQGYEVGKSLISGKETSAGALLKSGKVQVPEDVVVQTTLGKKEVRDASEVLADDIIYDIGPRSLETLKKTIAEARFILWNGPMGNFEAGYDEGTFSVAKFVAESSATSVVGGGDTVAAIERLGNAKDYTHVSSAGGAMLDFIGNGTIAGVEALK